MAEGLKKLERIKGHFNPKDIVNKELFEEDFNVIEKELKELEEHEEILNDYNLTLADFREACLLLAQWRSAGLNWADYEKQKKALEIIRDKQVAVDELLRCADCEDYNDFAGSNSLTQEEYELLKEVLTNWQE